MIPYWPKRFVLFVLGLSYLKGQRALFLPFQDGTKTDLPRHFLTFPEVSHWSQQFPLKAIFRSFHHFLFLNKWRKKSSINNKKMNTFENNMGNGTCAPVGALFHFPYLHNFDISKLSSCASVGERVKRIAALWSGSTLFEIIEFRRLNISKPCTDTFSNFSGGTFFCLTLSKIYANSPN